MTFYKKYLQNLKYPVKQACIFHLILLSIFHPSWYYLLRTRGWFFFIFPTSPFTKWDGGGEVGSGGLSSSNLSIRLGMKYFFLRWGWTKEGRLFRKGEFFAFDSNYYILLVSLGGASPENFNSIALFVQILWSFKYFRVHFSILGSNYQKFSNLQSFGR